MSQWRAMRVRYTLRNPKILRWCMDHPARGAPFTVRTLAALIGHRHHSTVGHLLTGERTEIDAGDARAIAEAVGVGVLVLFDPPSSPDQNAPSTRQIKEPA